MGAGVYRQVAVLLLLGIRGLRAAPCPASAAATQPSSQYNREIHAETLVHLPFRVFHTIAKVH